MNVQLVWIKIKERLNKLDSNDYDNIQCWQIVEAFNKAQKEWSRRQLHGYNTMKEGMEQTTRRVTDLQVLLADVNLTGSNQYNYFESDNFPTDFLEFNRVSADATTEDCPAKKLIVRFLENGNLDEWLRDPALDPNFEWGETFNTLSGNKVRIYHENKFNIINPVLSYYRQPRNISLAGCPDINGNDLGDIDPEFKDDIVELIIDDAAAILAGDIESWNQYQRNSQNSEKNN
jgi:hypothetical protein